MDRKLLPLSVLAAACTSAAAPDGRADLGSDELEAYFEHRVAELEDPLAAIQTPGQWEESRSVLKKQLLEMLGLDPLPERSELQAVVTGKVAKKGFTMEKVYFQSRPGLYVTGNLYLPDPAPSQPVPGILYVCGHGNVKIDDVSYGSKAAYQHHGIWFARNGYVCLIIDTLQLGEIEGIHHGTCWFDRWWWNARGYTPAGVEAWNSIRALDYLETRPEVDREKLGVTGRSGGGAYSWWAASLDERVKAAVPVAGITSLRNHVVDGCIEGHCDCMYPVNTYRWDFARVSALVAPRPLLISNTDKDNIFPLDGVVGIYYQTLRIYELLNAVQNIGLNIEEGPHEDTQPLRTSAFHWFNRFLKGHERTDVFAMAAVKELEPSEIKVLEAIPSDQINTVIDETFVPMADPVEPPENGRDWKESKDKWMAGLCEKSFRGWPDETTPPRLKQLWKGVEEGVRLEVYTLTPEPDVTCDLFLFCKEGLALDQLTSCHLDVLDSARWEEFLGQTGSIFPEAFPDVTVPKIERNLLQEALLQLKTSNGCLVYACPRGIGLRPWPGEKPKSVQIRRRFPLIGQTQDTMRTWDIRQAVRALRDLAPAGISVQLEADGVMAGNALYASLFLEQPVTRLELHNLPPTHREGPIYLNVLRILDMPQALAMAAERSAINLHTASPEHWEYARETVKQMNWPEDRLQITELEPARP